MQVEEVDVLTVKLSQRGVEIGDHLRPRERLAVGADMAFGGNDDAVACPSLDGLADDGFRAVGGRRIQEVDAEVERFLHQGHALRLAEAIAQPDAAVAAAAEPGHADPQLRLAERGIVHRLQPWLCRG